MEKESWIIVTCIFLIIPSVRSYTYEGYSCTSGNLGVATPSNYNDGYNNVGTGRLYFVENSQYMSSCCGVITSWEFNARTTGTLELVVWRRVTGTKWKISGKNRISVTSTGSQTYDPSTSTLGDYKLTIQPGDYIGWYSLGNDIISYKASSSKLTRVQTSVSSVSIGDTTDWSSYTVDSTDRDYAIRANYGAGSAPSIVPVGSISMPDSTVANTVIHTVTYTSADQNDDIYLTVKSESSSYFNFDTSTYEISPKYSYTPEGSYTMMFRILDQCGNEDTDTGTITVSNVGVSIDNIPTGTAFTVAEALESQITMHSITTTDNSAEDFTYCVLGNSGVGPFIVEQNDAAAQTYDIKVRDWPQFDYDVTPEYLLRVECDDGSTTAASTFTVHIQKNQGPYFTNTYWLATADAEVLEIGKVIFTLTAADPEGDNVYYSMTCNPTGCPFVLLDSGHIVTSEILIHHSISEYTLSVTVSDGRRTSTARSLAVQIFNINAKPVLNNVPPSLSVTENTALGSSLYTFTAVDDDVHDTVYFSIYYSDGEAASLFTFDPSTGILTTSPWNPIDYDELTTKSFTATISAGDGKFRNTEMFTINVKNQNEAPVFLQKYYATYQLEGVSQTTLPLPTYVYDEPDNDAVTFTFDCGSHSGRFLMDSTNGEIKYNHDYDLDLTNIPTEVICTLKISDPSGLFDTAELAINIVHDNEHDPQFTVTSFHFYVDSTEYIGEVIGKVYASESDGSDTDHGLFYYTLDQTGVLKEYFGINNEGQIYVKESLSELYLGQIIVISVTATDFSGRKQTISVTIEVPTFTTTTEPVSPEPVLRYLTSPQNMPPIVGASILFCVISILLFWLLLKYGKCPGGCTNKEKRNDSLKTEDTHLGEQLNMKRTKNKHVLDKMFGIKSSNGKLLSSTDF